MTKINSKYSLRFKTFLLTLVLTLIYIVNLFYNWGYYKQYDGPETSTFLFAKYFEVIIRYVIILLFLFVLLLSVFPDKEKDNSDTQTK